MRKHFLPILGFILIGFITLNSCVKKDFDSPPDPSNIDPKLAVNSTIFQLKQFYDVTANPFPDPYKIVDDITISGIVISDDRTGGFYKEITIQDSTGGLKVKLGRSSLYTEYPLGRKVYIKCKGLYLGSYGKYKELGYIPDETGSLTDIPSSLIGKYVIKANYPNTITPRIVTMAEIKSNVNNDNMIGTLVQIDSAEFIEAQVGGDYAVDPNTSSGTDRTIEDCATGKTVVRMSGYATYRKEKIPAGKGTIVAIFTRYNNTAQLLIRDTTDIKFNGPRCGGVIIQPGVNVSIDSVRKLYTSNMKLGNYQIHGIVTSSYKDSNITKGSLYMQDESGRGINVYYGNKVLTYKMGDSITVDVSGDSLIVYRGNLEIKKLNGDKTTIVSSGKTVTPKVVTIAELNTDLDNPTLKLRQYESVLVKVMNCTITGTGGFMSGNNNLTDATGTIISYCRNAIPFTTTALPSGTFNYTGLAVKFNSTNEVTVRKVPDDIQ